MGWNKSVSLLTSLWICKTSQHMLDNFFCFILFLGIGINLLVAYSSQEKKSINQSITSTVVTLTSTSSHLAPGEVCHSVWPSAAGRINYLSWWRLAMEFISEAKQRRRRGHGASLLNYSSSASSVRLLSACRPLCSASSQQGRLSASIQSHIFWAWK